jgi:hypothetical protein
MELVVVGWVSCSASFSIANTKLALSKHVAFLKTITLICISRFQFAYITYLSVLVCRRRWRSSSTARKNAEWIHERYRIAVVNRLRERFIFRFRQKEAG